MVTQWTARRVQGQDFLMELHPTDDPNLIRICSALGKAKWIDRFSPVIGSRGLNWTAVGRCRKDLLVRVIEEFRLLDHRTAPFDFSFACEDARGNKTKNFEGAARIFWTACLEELSLPHEEEVLRVFVALLTDFAGPEQDSLAGLAGGPSPDTIPRHGDPRRNF
jgi:hypothetical protein